MVNESSRAGLERAAALMRRDGLPEPVIQNFKRLFHDVMLGKTGVITEAEIEPVAAIDCFSTVSVCNNALGKGMELLDNLVVIRLNGGLGTTMGLERAKSLLRVKEGLSFNDIIAKQLQALGARSGASIPLVHMTSFSTDADVKHAMGPYRTMSSGELPVSFLQHRHPKIYVDTMSPAEEPLDELNWNPPGHGDIYAALLATGLAEKLLALGKRYAFVANADNLGATVEPSILGYFASSGAPFLMETAERTQADAKGGHLARRKGSGRLVLRESSQAPTAPGGEIIPEFQDVLKYRHFNTNNIWLDLEAVVRVAREHEGSIPLPLISNKKTVNPRDRGSRRVIQIETAMGAAIEVFEGARALQVPRSRFAPVKSNNDLLVVRSDAYLLSDQYTLSVNPARTISGLPAVSLDPHFFGLLKDFESRMKAMPSLVGAKSFTVKGNVEFGHPVTIEGSVAVLGPAEKLAAVPKESTLLRDQELSLL